MPSPLPSLILPPSAPPASTLHSKGIKSLWQYPGGHWAFFSLGEGMVAPGAMNELPWTPVFSALGP